MKLFAGHQWRTQHRQQTYGHGGSGWVEGEGRMYGESNMETYICKTDTNENSLYDSSNSNQGSVTTWMGGDG